MSSVPAASRVKQVAKVEAGLTDRSDSGDRGLLENGSTGSHVLLSDRCVFGVPADARVKQVAGIGYTVLRLQKFPGISTF